MNEVTEEPKWTLVIGIHHGTFTSRDSEMPKKMASLEACQDEVTKAERDYAMIGCYIWFAKCTDPEGNDHHMNFTRVPYESGSRIYQESNRDSYGFAMKGNWKDGRR